MRKNIIENIEMNQRKQLLFIRASRASIVAFFLLGLIMFGLELYGKLSGTHEKEAKVVLIIGSSIIALYLFVILLGVCIYFIAKLKVNQGLALRCYEETLYSFGSFDCPTLHDHNSLNL